MVKAGMLKALIDRTKVKLDKPKTFVPENGETLSLRSSDHESSDG